jgi:hypothetical protein
MPWKIKIKIMPWKIWKENIFMSFYAKVDFLGSKVDFLGQQLTFVDFFLKYAQCWQKGKNMWEWHEVKLGYDSCPYLISLDLKNANDLSIRILLVKDN